MVENMDEEEYFVQGWLGWDGAPMHVEYITASICLQRANPLSMDDIKAFRRRDAVDTPTEETRAIMHDSMPIYLGRRDAVDTPTVETRAIGAD